MVCDLETGICGVAEENELELIDFNKTEKSVDLYYVTDPICSHCWAIEPVIGRFVKQYGKHFNFHTVMGACWKNGMMDLLILQTEYISQLTLQGIGVK